MVVKTTPVRVRTPLVKIGFVTRKREKCRKPQLEGRADNQQREKCPSGIGRRGLGKQNGVGCACFILKSARFSGLPQASQIFG